MTAARAHVVFSGRVQGVGFRYTARMVAARFAVSGWVRNLSDGTVELEAQGERAEVEAFLDSLRADMTHYIVDARVCWRGPSRDEGGFEVRF